MLTKQLIEQRLIELKSEANNKGQEAAQAAFNQAVAPYISGIQELERLLTFCEDSPEVPSPE